jgi:hypothetical protein
MTPVHLRAQWWAVQLPEDAKNIRVEKYGEIPYLDYNYSVQEGRRFKALSGLVELPPGSWQILCTLKECTEEQAKKIVEYYDNGFGATIYRNFDDQGLYGARPLLFWKAIESLHSLIRARKLNTETNILILQNTDTALQSWNQKEGV